MFVNKRGMMNHHLLKSLAFVIALYTSPSMADEADKLKELENAINAPAVEVVQKHTRAIILDEKPNSAEANEHNEVAAKVNSTDCSTMQTDARSTAVDFSIQFKSGSSEIAASSEHVLEEIAKILSLTRKCVIVEGHTDSIGNAGRNMLLSRERADSVVNYISDQGGLDRKRLIPVGKGSNEPLMNLNPRNPKNRRVVFKVVN
jgi:outer membrane protein OmpA-like peptidoglycan-associated protein